MPETGLGGRGPITRSALLRQRPSTRAARRRSGFTLLEVVVALPIVLVALGMFVQMITAGVGLRESGRLDWVASSAAQEVLEEMRNEDFREVFRLYNEDPFDDPAGPGTAPGNRFEVQGLDPVDEWVGEVVLPAWNLGTEVVPDWQLREDLALRELSMPRDLNGDVLLDEEDRSADYTILPVMIRVRWRGISGPREFRLNTVFTELR